MRTITSERYEVKLQYEKLQENGLLKNVTEQYVVDAMSFTEAEKKITEEMESYISGDFCIKTITRAPYREIMFDDCSDKWYRTKLEFITIDEKTEKEKKTLMNYLVQADSLDEAKRHITEVMSATMIAYTISSIAETKIMDVFEHKLSKK
jgi:hypothetical protein